VDEAAPTLGFRIFWLKDAGLQEDCFRVYNDWVAQYCSYAPKMLYERFFASDPLTRARILNAIYPKEEVTRRVLDFLERSDDTS
jgi:hypothetical protein